MPIFWKTWEWVYNKIQKLNERKSRPAEVRSVALLTLSGYRNHATYLYIPMQKQDDAVSVAPSRHLGELALLAKTAPLNNLLDHDSFKTEVTFWSGLGNLQDLTVQSSKDFQVWFEGSNNRFGPMPVWIFEFAQRISTSVNLPPGPFLSHQHPLYESVVDAAADWMGDPILNPNPAHTNLCLLWVSDATIKNVNNDEAGKLMIEIASLGDISKLHLSLIAKYSGKVLRANQKAANHVVFDVPSPLDSVTLYLLDENDEPHDFFSETTSYSTWPTRVLRRGGLTLRGKLLDEIHQGEGMKLEFKEWLPIKSESQKRWELYETVAAFANTNGGTIMVGVDDRGNIVGVGRNLRRDYNQLAGAELAELFRAYQADLVQNIKGEIYPDVNIEFEKIDLDNETVLLIHVAQGIDPPYSLISRRDVYIRRGANNMKPTRDELQQLYNKASKKPPTIL